MSDLAPSIPIRAAGLLPTDWCSARCRHCYVQAGPEGARWMTVEAAAGHLAALARLGVEADEVHIGGGEPFGDFDRLLAIVRAARDAGLAGVGYVETNGYWATSEKVVRERLTALAAAGMRQISLSADPYHQEFVPPECVQLLYATAREVLGPGGVRVRRWKWLREARNVAAMTDAERTALLTEFLRRYPERMSGRAADELAPLAPRVAPDALPADGCRAAILESGHVHVDPDGWVYPGTCAGLVLGRATADHPLDAVLRGGCGEEPRDGIEMTGWHAHAAVGVGMSPLREEHAQANSGLGMPPSAGETPFSVTCNKTGLALSPLLAALVAGGPRRLLEAVAGGGFQPDAAGYAGKCHLCWAIRRHLVRTGAEKNTFLPATLYLTS